MRVQYNLKYINISVITHYQCRRKGGKLDITQNSFDKKIQFSIVFFSPTNEILHKQIIKYNILDFIKKIFLA